MRGPLFSGAIGSPAALQRLCQILRTQPPAVVLSSLWLAEALAEEIPVLALIEPDVAKAARRAGRKAAEAGRSLQTIVAGVNVPLAQGRVGALVLESLVDVEDEDLPAFVLGLSAALQPDGLVVSLDRAKDPAAEARIAAAFLAAGLRDIAQERPREGAVLTVGRAQRPAVLRALA